MRVAELARDVYITVYQSRGLAMFDNIAASEETRTTAVEDRLEKCRLPDPVVDDTVGVFVNPDLASLYTNLVARGSQNPVEALYVGAAIEETDMIDLQAAIDATDNAASMLAFRSSRPWSRWLSCRWRRGRKSRWYRYD